MSSYQSRADENAALVNAIISVIRHLPESKQEAALAKACEDPRVHDAVTREVEKSFKKSPTFSPLAKGIENYSSMAHNSEELSKPALPSGLAKRRAEAGRS